MNDDEARRERQRHGQEGPEDRLQRERVGVAGDPVPDHEYGDPKDELARVELESLELGEEPEVPAGSANLAAELEDLGLLTLRQALAYVLRELHDVRRPHAAAMMGVDPSTLDTHLAAAREKVSEAAATVNLIRGVGGDV